MAEEQIEATADPAPVDTPVSDSPATESDLDALLAQFESETARPTDQPADQVDQNVRDQAVAENLRAITEGYQIDQRRNELQAQEQYLRAQQDAGDEIEAFKQIRGSLDIDDEQIKGFVLARVLNNPTINEVWNNRRENPAAYSRMVEKLNGDLQLHVEQQRQKFLSEEAAADHFAVAQAMRGQGGKAPPEPPPNFGRMSNAEFAQYKRSIGME